MNPLTGLAAVLPPGAAVEHIAIYRDGDSSISDGAVMQLGTADSTTRFMALGDSITTDQLNRSHCISRAVLDDFGEADEAELRIELSSELSLGAVMFEITYFIYS
jgi:hypothetical protein